MAVESHAFPLCMVQPFDAPMHCTCSGVSLQPASLHLSLLQSDSEDEFVPLAKQRGTAAAAKPSGAAAKPPGAAAASKKRVASRVVIDDSESESDSGGENVPAPRGARQPGGASAAASREVQRLTEELRDAVEVRVSAERRLRHAQAAEAELQRQLSGQGATTGGAAAEGGGGGRGGRSARSSRRDAPVSYRDDDDSEEEAEAAEERQPAGRRSSGEHSMGLWEVWDVAMVLQSVKQNHATS